MTPWLLPPRWRPSIEAVCRLDGVHITRLLSPRRDRWTTDTRRKAARLLVWQGLSSVQAGQLLGRHHTTILHHLVAK